MSNKKASGQGWLQGLNEQQAGMYMNTKKSHSQDVNPWTRDDQFSNLERLEIQKDGL